MPAPIGTDTPNRLRLGQGVPGGGAGLPTPGGSAPPLGGSSLALPRRRLPLGPPAQDVTPQRPVASATRLPSTEGMGAALLSRGWPNIVAGGITKPRPGVSKALKLLSDPDRLFEPGNKRQLNLIMKPGPNVQAAIDADPHLQANQRGLQDHVLTKGAGAKLPAQDLIKKLHADVGSGKVPLDQFVMQHKVQLMGLDDDAKQRFAAASHVAVAKSLGESAFPINTENNIFSHAADQMGGIVTGMIPGMVQLATHPLKTGKAMAEATGKYYGPLVTGHPGQFLHNFNEQPLTPIMDIAAVASAGVGTGARVGAVSDALKTAGEASAIEDLGNGAARVGGRYGVHPMKNGRVMVRDQSTNQIIGNLPDMPSAVAHAQSLGSDMAHQSAFRTAIHAFTHPELYGKTRGGVLDQLEAHSAHAQARIDLENKSLMEEIQSVADNPNLKLGRRSMKEVLQHAKADFQSTMNEMRTGPHELLASQPQFYNRATSTLGHATMQTYRELLSGVRLGAIYLRPAYLPNNWAGNTFMNLTHQGFLAPVNLAKSVVIYKHLEPRNLAMMRKAMGENPAQAAYEGVPRGFISSAGQPLVQGMGKVADQPFRDAAFLHEARRQGYRKLSQVNGLLKKAQTDEAALKQVADIGRRGQEEIVKFGHLNPTERKVASNVLFVYNWVKGSTRYAARFPLQHPLQSDAYAHLAPEGQKYVQSQMGGVPWFLAGSIPVGHKDNGDPVLINPFALNPLGTSVQVARAAAGTYKAIRHTGDFNKYADSSVADLTNPLVQETIKAITGQNPNVRRDLEQSIAPVRFAQDMMHPGRGNMFPMTRQEALGHYIFGSLYPRRASQTAIERALERQNQGNPQKMLDDQITQYTKSTGQAPDDKLISQVRADVDAMQQMKKFQRDYAGHLGSQGFKNLPAQNRAEAGLAYLRQYSHLPPESITGLEQAVKAAPNDAVLDEVSNEIWGMSNTGYVKRQWDQMVKDLKPPTKTAPRK